jgi:hypothetical protein
MMTTVPERCPDCLTVCPWCGQQRWQTREQGCGAVADGQEAKSCRKARRLKGIPCPRCGSGPPPAAPPHGSTRSP